MRTINLAILTLFCAASFLIGFTQLQSREAMRGHEFQGGIHREQYHPRAREDLHQQEFNRNLNKASGAYQGGAGVQYVPVNPYPPPPAPLEPAVVK